MRDADIGGYTGSPEQLAWSKQSTAYWVNVRCFGKGASKEFIH